MANDKHDNYACWSEVFSEFPDPELFEPGTEIMKVGAKTGITKGFLLEHSATLDETTNGKRTTWKEMIKSSFLLLFTEEEMMLHYVHPLVNLSIPLALQEWNQND